MASLGTRQTAARYISRAARVNELRALAAGCTACDLHARATQTVFGSGFRVTRERGTPIPWHGGPTGFATIHPSSILRVPDRDARAAAYNGFVADLCAAPGSAH